ncbi:30666_t:CDS:2 [Gigaspora margarita]|uniref:30666_t:CDS:1 n=1 Tax=Gigaspora margarita TaxID=4874 RepID=A0ABN7VJR3_GIGMA|nr:30666_t:CDS:2 [Gigaspora margarita]
MNEKRYQDQENVYHSFICYKCIANEETSDHLAACPVDKEIWKQLEEKIAEKIWDSISSDSQKKVDQH